MLTNVSDIYNELYYIYKNKYNKKIDTLSAENKKLIDYKQLKLSDHTYLSKEKEEEEEKQEKKSKIKKQLM